ncbi:MAG: Bug family tripartite tricarboxylate transporter substrate binding protein [Xanthobacteraceae bacterium]
MLRFLAALVALSVVAAKAPAQEQWPSRPINLIVPYAAGTAPDVIARLLSDQLSVRLGQPVVVDNKTGAGGLIGTEAAAGSKNDGYTLFLGSLDTQAIIGHLYTKRKHDPATALVPISILGRIVNVIAASPALNIGSMKELLEAGKQGRTFTFATPGVGTNLHLIGELIKQRTGVNLNHVPYRAASAGYTDAMAGRIDLVIAGLPPLAGLLRDNKLKSLVTTAPDRVPTLPDTPTMAEIGHKELTVIGWFGLLAPAGTSPEIINKLHAEVKAITQSEAYRNRMRAMFIDPVSSSSPEEFGALIKAESERFGEVVRAANIKVHQ